jgi:glycosyltransferase involved in cell wall biosynthesis
LKIVWFSWKDVRHPLAGGAERLGHEWRRRLVVDGHAVRHVTARYPGSAESDAIDGVETIRRGQSSVTHYPAARAFHRESRGWADCVVEEINTVPYFVAAPAAPGRAVLLYFQLAREIWFHQTALPVAIAGYGAEAVYTWLQSRRGTPVITISEDSRRDLVRFGFSPARVKVVRIGIDNSPLTTFDPSAKERRFTVLFHGSLRAMKRPLDAFEAFAAYVASRGDGVLWISGGGDNGTIRRASASRRLDERLTLFGRTSEEQKLDLMRRASVLIATSVKEGWGLIVTEANSMATPAIVYDADGLRSAAGRHNWVAPATPGALAERLADARRVFETPAAYQDWCGRVLADSRQYTLDASYRDFRAALLDD